jgi:HSP20 family protein
MSSGFDDFYNLLDNFFIPQSLDQGTFKLDVQDTETEYIIEADLPGIQKDEISLDLNDGHLTIAVKREENVENNQKNYLHHERRVSSMSRAIYLADANPEDIKAKLNNGLLTISVQKQSKQIASTKIDIQS